MLVFSFKVEFFKRLKTEEKMKVILSANEMFPCCQAAYGWKKNDLDLTRNSKAVAFSAWWLDWCGSVTNGDCYIGLALKCILQIKSCRNGECITLQSQWIRVKWQCLGSHSCWLTKACPCALAAKAGVLLHRFDFKIRLKDNSYERMKPFSGEGLLVG